MEQDKESQFLSISKHPLHGVILSLGKLPYRSEVWILDKEKRDFVLIGEEVRIKGMRLTKKMNLKKATKWINQKSNSLMRQYFCEAGDGN